MRAANSKPRFAGVLLLLLSLCHAGHGQLSCNPSTYGGCEARGGLTVEEGGLRVKDTSGASAVFEATSNGTCAVQDLTVRGRLHGDASDLTVGDSTVAAKISQLEAEIEWLRARLSAVNASVGGGASAPAAVQACQAATYPWGLDVIVFGKGSLPVAGPAQISLEAYAAYGSCMRTFLLPPDVVTQNDVVLVPVDSPRPALHGIGVSSHQRFDVLNGTWSSRTPVASRSLYDCALLGDSIYCPGGYNVGSSTTLASVARYVFATDTWSTTGPSLSAARKLLGCVAHNGTIYAIGGEGSTSLSFQRTVEASTGGASPWTLKTQMPTARRELAVVEHDGYIYAIGGYTVGAATTGAVERYDPATNTWTALAPLSVPRCNLEAVSYRGALYALGGNTLGSATAGITNVVELYDPVRNAWSIVTASSGSPMAAARENFGAAAVSWPQAPY